MSGGRLAAQSVHATLALASVYGWTPEELYRASQLTCVVLEASDKKFEKAVKAQLEAGNKIYIFHEEDPEPYQTAVAFLEENPKNG